jgi:DNA-binding response OmpR family regulator
MGVSEQKEAALLLWIEGEEIKGRWTLDQPVTSIGRWADNDLVVDDRWVSRYHAQVRREGEQCIIEDLDSKNGTFVNGRRITEATVLADGDEVYVTPVVRLTFVDYGSTAPLPAEAQASDLKLDLEARQVRVLGRLLTPPLSHAQFMFLALLAEQPGRVYSRDEVIAVVWADDQAEGVSDEAIDALVRRIRLRLRELDPDHDYVTTVRGYGFKLEAQLPPAHEAGSEPSE